MSDETRHRLDEALVVRGLAPSRSRARDMILRGTVSIDGRTEAKPARMISAEQEVAVADAAAPYVSRAALKLIAGLDAFGFDPAGLDVIDLGASTGGFSQVLLERGARNVVAVDVAKGEMNRALASDPRIILLRNLNARDLSAAHLAGRNTGAVVADVSFISLKLALPPALALAATGAWGVCLVKPQFEVGPKQIGKGGVVRDTAAAKGAAEGIAAWLEKEQGWRVVGLIPSPIEGGSGNREFLLGARKP